MYVIFQGNGVRRKFDLHNGKVQVAEVLCRFQAAVVEFEDSDGILVKLTPDVEGFSTESFQGGSTVNITCAPVTPNSGRAAVCDAGEPGNNFNVVAAAAESQPFYTMPYALLDEIEGSILSFCNAFGKRLEPELRKIPRDEGSYAMQFPSSLGPVCSVDKVYPSLLWDGVPPGGIVENVWIPSANQEQFTMFLAPSGSGKTRTLIETACTSTSLYFVGRSRDIRRGQGSADMNALADHLEALYGRNQGEEILPETLRCCVAALVISRLYILSLLKKICPDITHREWTFFQLEYASITDVFHMLTQGLLSTFVKKGSVATAFKFMLLKWAGNPERTAFRSSWSSRLILDEAQIIDQHLPERFVGDKGVRRSLLHSFLVTLVDLGLGSSISLAGTGESLLKIKSTVEESGSLKRFSFQPVYSLSGFSSTQELATYMSRFVDTSVLDVEKIYSNLGKRRRFIATALETYMCRDDPGTMTFLRYGYEVCTKSGAELGLLHSLKDDVMKFLRRHREGTLLRQAALANYYTGLPTLVTGLHEVKELLNCSLGEFVTGNDIDAEAGFVIQPGAEHAYGAVKISEPLVVRAILLNIPEEDHYDGLLRVQRDAGSIGTLYEPLLCVGLERYFKSLKGLLADKLFSLEGAVDPVYNEVCTLVQPLVGGKPLVTMVSKKYGLEHFVADVQNGTASVFFHLGGDGLARADLLLFLKGVRSNKKFPVLVQVKTGTSFSLEEAFESVDVLNMYAGKGHKSPDLEAALKTLRDWSATGYLQMVVAPVCEFPRPPRASGPSSRASVPPLRCLVQRESITVLESTQLDGLLATLKKTKAACHITCQGITKKGTECTNRLKPGGSTKCWMHEK